MKKSSSVLLLLLLLHLFLAGCSGQKADNPEALSNLLDNTVQMTNKAIEMKDIKLARTIWEQISEYGIKAKELGRNDLSESLGQLASTYVYLIDYIHTGREEQLTLFRENFQRAVDHLKEIIKEPGKTKR
ncbi:MAG: hypothetical protein QHH10_07325 [Peptococcaceae bacterium]|jgi:hypothetical protein|nr:hypothetical protein [Peptococcaceae bacterium]MDH7525110.1 hypothetical protein [Peptococcaceae bacterium]